jgi:hypothetical protein
MCRLGLTLTNRELVTAQYPRMAACIKYNPDIEDSGCGVHQTVPQRLQYNYEPWMHICRLISLPRISTAVSLHNPIYVASTPSLLTYLFSIRVIPSICLQNSSLPLLQLQPPPSSRVRWENHALLQAPSLVRPTTAAHLQPPTEPSSKLSARQTTTVPSSRLPRSESTHSPLTIAEHRRRLRSPNSSPPVHSPRAAKA